jgi:hypothetical protein
MGLELELLSCEKINKKKKKKTKIMLGHPIRDAKIECTK